MYNSVKTINIYFILFYYSVSSRVEDFPGVAFEALFLRQHLKAAFITVQAVMAQRRPDRSAASNFNFGSISKMFGRYTL